MPLTNFGSILKFAEELEVQDQQFYLAAADKPGLSTHAQLFSTFAADLKKNQKILQRIRRENVTEMILEPVEGLTRAEFTLELTQDEDMDAARAIDGAQKLEDRAQRYYWKAAEQIKAQPEVARGLKQIAKKRAAHLNKLHELS